MFGNSEVKITDVLLDSRKFTSSDYTIFIAIGGPNHNGHHFINEMIDKGIYIFLVDKKETIPIIDEITYIKVDDTLKAFQKLAAHHKSKFKNLQTIAITGSNGKTIVKEWLYYILKDHFNIVRSPRSYNSQIGVPLSIWQINNTHNLGIFEAGISEAGEMEALEEIIQPQFGILTNIGNAHDAGFNDAKHKLEEKGKLFNNCQTIVYNKQNRLISQHFKQNFTKNTLGWGGLDNADLKIENTQISKNGTTLNVVWQKQKYTFWLPFVDDASIENAIICLLCALYAKLPIEHIKNKLATLPTIAMHMELIEGINQCSIINDSYSNDLESLSIALDFLARQSIHEKKTLILSDFEQIKTTPEELQTHLLRMLNHKKINRLIGVGKLFESWPQSRRDTKEFLHYNSTEDLLADFGHILFEKESILIKGARQFAFEKIVELLVLKTHNTFLEVNLNALQHNLNTYKSFLKPAVKVMVMVKAFAYGSGLNEVAKLLAFNKVDYLAVAYVDEGIALRDIGIKIPIMVMNATQNQWVTMSHYKLESEIYSLELLKKWITFKQHLINFDLPIHIKLDSGMHRLGVMPNELQELCDLVSKNQLKIVSVMSHLAASESDEHRRYGLQQIDYFVSAAQRIEQAYGEPFIKHILNSNGIANFLDAQFDMVRLGIGLYGISGSSSVSLQNVLCLKTYISQIKTVNTDEPVGYGLSYIAPHPIRIAIIAIGYADGLDRRYSNGGASVLIDNQLAPVIGNVCMDMAIVNITEISSAYVGKEVLIFGNELSINEIADRLGTIPYEIISRISTRVKRVYIEE